MKLTAKLAHSQLITNRSRTIWTLVGIILSTAMIAAIYGFVTSGNSMFADAMGEDYYNRGLYMTSLIGAVAVLSTIIISASVTVVSNSFYVSAGERTTQFGILKSIGATKKQITTTVMYESVLLSVVGIPIGIAVGILVELASIQIANHFLAGFKLNEAAVILRFVVSWQAIIASILIAFLTVLLSAWLPARKAAMISAIDAIRGTDEVKLKTESIRANWLIQKLFGVEGTFAYKSLKRSRRNYRATVLSLTISIILFIVASSIGTQGAKMVNMLYPNIDANVVGQYTSRIESFYGQVQYLTLDSNIADEITAQLCEFHDTRIAGAGAGYITYSAKMTREMLAPQTLQLFPEQDVYDIAVSLVSIDPKHYEELCEQAGVPLGSNILINHRSQIIDGKITVFKPIVFNSQTIYLTSKHDEPSIELELHGQLCIGEIPSEVLYSCRGYLNVLVPHGDMVSYNWFADTKDIDGFMEYANTILYEMIPQDNESKVNIKVQNIEETKDTMNNVSHLIMIFIYGFVGLLTLIGMTNIISTISTNVRSRSREFAVLRSVGMTQQGLNRMLSFESIMCSTKSLIFGLPIGTIASWLIYRFIMASADFEYTLPWLAMAECILGISVITWIIMYYAVKRLRNRNTINTIRADGGV